MSDEEIKELIERTASRTTILMVDKLKRAKRIKCYDLNSFTRTEKVLTLYPKLSDGDPDKLAIEKALNAIRDDDMYGVIESRYFDGMTFEEIAEIYDKCYQQISKERIRLVKLLAMELFPNEVLKETLDR